MQILLPLHFDLGGSGRKAGVPKPGTVGIEMCSQANYRGVISTTPQGADDECSTSLSDVESWKLLPSRPENIRSREFREQVIFRVEVSRLSGPRLNPVRARQCGVYR